MRLHQNPPMPFVPSTIYGMTADEWTVVGACGLLLSIAAFSLRFAAERDDELALRRREAFARDALYDDFADDASPIDNLFEGDAPVTVEHAETPAATTEAMDAAETAYWDPPAVGALAIDRVAGIYRSRHDQWFLWRPIVEEGAQPAPYLGMVVHGGKRLLTGPSWDRTRLLEETTRLYVRLLA